MLEVCTSVIAHLSLLYFPSRISVSKKNLTLLLQISWKGCMNLFLSYLSFDEKVWNPLTSRSLDFSKDAAGASNGISKKTFHILCATLDPWECQSQTLPSVSHEFDLKYSFKKGYFKYQMRYPGMMSHIKKLSHKKAAFKTLQQKVKCY